MIFFLGGILIGYRSWKILEDLENWGKHIAPRSVGFGSLKVLSFFDSKESSWPGSTRQIIACASRWGKPQRGLTRKANKWVWRYVPNKVRLFKLLNRNGWFQSETIGFEYGPFIFDTFSHVFSLNLTWSVYIHHPISGSQTPIFVEVPNLGKTKPTWHPQCVATAGSKDHSYTLRVVWFLPGNCELCPLLSSVFLKLACIWYMFV